MFRFVPPPVTALARKAAALFRVSRGDGGGIRWVGGNGWGGLLGRLGTLPDSDWDYASEVGEPHLNGAVGACLGWYRANFTQPDGRVYSLGADRGSPDQFAPLATHPLIDVLEDPNPDYDADALWAATLLDWFVSGNAFWVKARAKAGRKLWLYWAPACQMSIRLNPSKTAPLVVGYTHTVDGVGYPLDPADVVHFRCGLDPARIGLGLAPLAPFLREIATDNNGSIYSAAILRNMGIPGVIIQPGDPSGDMIDATGREQLSQDWSSRTTGENRGRPLVSSIQLKIDQFGTDPEKMALDKLRAVPEDRICSAFHINAMVANLTAGASVKTYANYDTANRSAYHSGLVPLQKTFARTMTRQLLWPDFGGAKGRDYFAWDYSDVPAMAEDQDALASRAALLFGAGVIRRGTACGWVGVPCDADEDVYVYDASQPPASPSLAAPGPADGPVTSAGTKALPPVREDQVLSQAARVLAKVERELDMAMHRAPGDGSDPSGRVDEKQVYHRDSIGRFAPTGSPGVAGESEPGIVPVPADPADGPSESA